MRRLRHQIAANISSRPRASRYNVGMDESAIPYRPEFKAAIGRGLRLRCPRCGDGRLYTTFFRMNRECPLCGLGFYRESGYYVGAMMINYGITAFLVLDRVFAFSIDAGNVARVSGIENRDVDVCGDSWFHCCWCGRRAGFGWHSIIGLSRGCRRWIRRRDETAMARHVRRSTAESPLKSYISCMFPQANK